MFQHAINLQTWADIFERLDEPKQVAAGCVLTTVGRHPSLGTLVAIQDTEELIILHSELPFDLIVNQRREVTILSDMVAFLEDGAIATPEPGSIDTGSDEAQAA